MIGNWQQPTSRLAAAEMIVILVEAILDKGIDEIAEENEFDMTDAFSDTDSKAATFLKAAGISTGVGGDRYNPDGTYTRAMMVTMLGRMAEKVFGLKLGNFQLGTDVFNDLPAGYAYADQYIGWAAQVGITQGIGGGLFDSDRELQNQQSGVLTLRAYENLTG